MKKLKKQTLDGNIETMLLLVLADGPSYGYQIVQDINEKAGEMLDLGEGTVYPVLHRIEKRELIKGFWRTGENGRPRKYYRLTPRGKEALLENARQWNGLVDVMSKLFGTAEPATAAVKS